MDTIGTSAPAGDMTTMSKGMAAPTENVTAEANAACTQKQTFRKLTIFVQCSLEVPS